VRQLHANRFGWGRRHTALRLVRRLVDVVVRRVVNVVVGRVERREHLR
jgi:hypothetical protein